MSSIIIRSGHIRAKETRSCFQSRNARNLSVGQAYEAALAAAMEATSAASMVGTVTYNAAGQLFGSETRGYNSLGQLITITAPGMNLTYNYTAGQNSGKIASQTDAITGETVTYAYDSLNRLISAQSASTWGQGFQYDGFGNLTAKTVLAGSVPTFVGWS